MKVYILGFTNPHNAADYDEILGVFSSPKKARKEFDRIHGMDTKRQWKKITDGMRCFGGVYYITEYRVDEPLSGD